MYLIIDNFLDSWSLEKIRQSLSTSTEIDWEDGRITNIDHKGKINFRLFQKTKIFKDISKIVNLAIENNLQFKEYTIIKYLFGTQVTKTTEGGKYAKHLDVLFRKKDDTGQMVRSDLSFTIFLNEPEEYAGGNLVIERYGDFKLPAGSIIIYPSTEIHEVTKVISGERLVFVGWIESQVKNINHRNLLYDYYELLSGMELSEEKKLKELSIRTKLIKEFID
jgi:PKHD-type hydroxylase